MGGVSNPQLVGSFIRLPTGPYYLQTKPHLHPKAKSFCGRFWPHVSQIGGTQIEMAEKGDER